MDHSIDAPILDAQKVRETMRTLSDRIDERFPGSGLLGVSKKLVEIAAFTEERARFINRPMIWIRIIGWTLIVVLLVLALVIPLFLASGFGGEDVTLKGFLELGDPVLNEIVIVGALVFFLGSLEVRFKRRYALKAIHELRAIAHVIDMHQLTKDPDRVIRPDFHATGHSPKQTLSRFQLRRYLDYCSEMLSLIGKLAALYVQGFDDEIALNAVNEVESLASGLSGKIWQKIMILHNEEDQQKRFVPTPAAAEKTKSNPATE